MISKVNQELLEKFVNEFSQKINDHKYLHQYTSLDSISRTLKDIYDIVIYLQMTNFKSILNIGTGPGIFEHVAKRNNLNVRTVEYIDEPDKELNQFIREFFGTDIDYESTNFKNYKINTSDKFDAALISRFGPFQSSVTEQDMNNFFKEIFNYTEEIIIPNLLLSASASNYLNEIAEFDGFAYTLTNNSI
jgi:hypothetical protein